MLALLFVLTLSLGCRYTRIHGIAKHVKRIAEADSMALLMKKNYFDYTWFAAKAKVSVINNEGTTDFSASIRARKDSAIWVSISPALGIEAVRVLMSRDSVRVLDRFNKKYYSYDYGFFRSYTSVPVSLTTLQQILSGIPIYFDEDNVITNKQDTLVLLTSERRKLRNTVYLNPDYTMVRMDLVDSAVGKTLHLRYHDYNRDTNRPFALDREMDLNDSKQTRVFINFSRVRIDEPQKMPFDGKP